MALEPQNKIHKQQIDAGIKGRKKGHKFEELLTKAINTFEFTEINPIVHSKNHLFKGNPANILLQYIANLKNIKILKVRAWWLGGLATSGCGDTITDKQGKPITKCKSDILLLVESNRGTFDIGISIKTCSKKTPTNDQMYFTTASAFCNLLENNGIKVSNSARIGLSQFCGDIGYRPIDILPAEKLKLRTSDPRRFYWEELSENALKDWNEIFTNYQDDISKLLFQKAYKDDPFPPEILLHQTIKYDIFDNCSLAIFSIDEIIKYSRAHSGYVQIPYKIRKGTYKNDPCIHLAPRFGFIQFQRGGQKQHPTQLQFNLKAGYFNCLK